MDILGADRDNPETAALLGSLKELAGHEFALSDRDADDVVEMTMLRAASFHRRPKSGEELAAWLREIVREEAKLHLSTLTR